MSKSVLVALPVALVPALGIVQGGYQPDAWVWAGAIAAWGAAFAVAVTGSVGAIWEARLWIASACALAAWTALSALWSPAPAQSILDARRMVVYAAFVLALAALWRGRIATRALVAATHAAISLLVVYALARYLLSGRRYDQVEAFLLSNPLGYANAVGILAVLGMLLALVPIAGAGSPARRAITAATIPLLAAALELTGSDASYLALAVGLAASIGLHPRPSATARAAAAQVPAAVVASAVAAYSRLSDPLTPRLPGWAVLAVALACAGVAAAASRLRHERGGGFAPSRRLVAPAVALAAIAGAVAVASAGSTEPRSSYYRVAWHEFRTHPLVGGGAASFGHYWLLLGDPVRFGGALDAHSLYLETLAELGPVGLALLLLFLLVPLRRALERRSEPAIPFAAGAALAFLVHAGLDWDWEIPAVVVAGLATLAAVAFGSGEQPPPGRRRAVQAGSVALALALGAASIAGARSHTVPGALEKKGAPRRGAPPESMRDVRRGSVVVAVPVAARVPVPVLGT